MVQVLVFLLHVYAIRPDGTEEVLRFSNVNAVIDGVPYMRALHDLDDWSVKEVGVDVDEGLVRPRGAVVPEVAAVELTNPYDARRGRGRLDDDLAGLRFKGARYEFLWARVASSSAAALADFEPYQTGTIRKEPTPGDVVKLQLDPVLAALRNDFRQPRFQGLGGMHWMSPNDKTELVTIQKDLLPSDLGDEVTFALYLDMPPPTEIGRMIVMRGTDTPGPPLRLRVVSVDTQSGTWALQLTSFRDDGSAVHLNVTLSEQDVPVSLVFVLSLSKDLLQVWMNGEPLLSWPAGLRGNALPFLGDLEFGGSSATFALGYFRWFSRVLSDAEILAIDRKPLDPQRWGDDLVLALECNERFGSVLTDESGHGRHGVRSGYADDLAGWDSTRTGETAQYGEPIPVLLGRGYSLPVTQVDRKLGLWRIAGHDLSLLRYLFAAGVPLAKEHSEWQPIKFQSSTLTLGYEIPEPTVEAGQFWVPSQTLTFTGSTSSANDGEVVVARVVPDPHTQDLRPLRVEVQVEGPVTWTDGVFPGELRSTSPLWSLDPDGVIRYTSGGSILTADAWGDPRLFAYAPAPQLYYSYESASNVVALLLDGGYSDLAGRLAAPIPLALLPDHVGVYVAGRKPVADVLEPVLKASRGLLLERSDGSLEVRKWTLPEESTEEPVDIPLAAIDSVEPLDPVEAADALLVGYAQAWKTLDEGELAPSAPVWSAAYHHQPWRWVTYPPDAADVAKAPRLETPLLRQQDASDLAAWLDRLTDCRFYRLRLHAPLERQDRYPVGSVVRPRCRRWLTGAPKVLVMERQRFPFAGRVELTVCVVPEEGS